MFWSNHGCKFTCTEYDCGSLWLFKEVLQRLLGASGWDEPALSFAWTGCSFPAPSMDVLSQQMLQLYCSWCSAVSGAGTVSPGKPSSCSPLPLSDWRLFCDTHSNLWSKTACAHLPLYHLPNLHSHLAASWCFMESYLDMFMDCTLIGIPTAPTYVSGGRGRGRFFPWLPGQS